MAGALRLVGDEHVSPAQVMPCPREIELEVAGSAPPLADAIVSSGGAPVSGSAADGAGPVGVSVREMPASERMAAFSCPVQFFPTR